MASQESFPLVKAIQCKRKEQVPASEAAIDIADVSLRPKQQEGSRREWPRKAIRMRQGDNDHSLPEELPEASPTLVVDMPCQTGEGPLWHEDERVLYWLDIPAGRLFRYDPTTGLNSLAYQHPELIGGFTVQDSGALLLFCARGAILQWQHGTIEVMLEEIPHESDGQFNDLIADPGGRVFCGFSSSDELSSRLYRLDPDGTLTLLFDDIGLTNGLGFSPDLQTLYHTDSNNRRIYSLDYDRRTGDVGNRQILVETPDDGSVPDGMAVDTQGDIWSARWDGSALYRYSASGKPLSKVSFPVKKVSSVTFGGHDCTTAFVTTAGGNKRGAEEGPHAGSLFKVRLGVSGRMPFRSQVRI